MLLESGEKDRAGVLFIVSADTLSVYKAFADVKRLSLRNAILESSLTYSRPRCKSAFGGDAAKEPALRFGGSAIRPRVRDRPLRRYMYA